MHNVLYLVDYYDLITQADILVRPGFSSGTGTGLFEWNRVRA